MKSWQLILVTAIVVYILRDKISTLPGVSSLPSI